ncbi:MAG: hypothetical protein EA388_02790 [Nitriliruptor sp.]|nr:MAG: hypothetical protein EA388_02790 [Nitriliruptor sp.]
MPDARCGCASLGDADRRTGAFWAVVRVDVRRWATQIRTRTFAGGVICLLVGSTGPVWSPSHPQAASDPIGSPPGDG